MPNKALQQNRDDVLRCGCRVGCELLIAAVSRRKKMIRVFVVVLGFLIHCGCNAQDPQMVMHRVQAGTPDETGWITAASTNGGFSIKVPIPFNDFTVEEAKSSGPLQRAEVVGCKSAEGLKFSASKFFYKEAGEAAKRFEMSKAGGGSRKETVAQLHVNGLAALDATAGDTSTKLRKRTILAGEEIYVLIVEWPVQENELAEQLAGDFFGSFTILEEQESR